MLANNFGVSAYWLHATTALPVAACPGAEETYAHEACYTQDAADAAVVSVFLALLELGCLPQPMVAQRQQQGGPNQTPLKVRMNDLNSPAAGLHVWITYSSLVVGWAALCT
jgi:hypothetical protein